MSYKTYQSLPEQSIFDVSLMQYGSLEGGLERLLADNPNLIQAAGVVGMFGFAYRIDSKLAIDARMRTEMQRIVPVTEGGVDDLGAWVDPAYAPWVTPLAQVYATPTYTGGASGVRPDQFQEEASPSDANFEVYSQKGGVTRKAKLSRVGPGISTLGFIPSANNNTTHLNSVGTDPNGDVWFISGAGTAIKLSNGTQTATNWQREEQWLSGSSLVLAITLPASNYHVNLQVYRGGIKLRWTSDYAVDLAQNRLVLVQVADNEVFEVFSKTS